MSEIASTNVVISGDAITAGSSPIFFAKSGRVAPITLAKIIVKASDIATVRDTVRVTALFPKRIPSISKTLRKVATPRAREQSTPTRSSFQITRKISENSTSEREILLVTVTDDCPPELPPVPIIIGMNRTRTAGSADSKPASIALDKVEESISIRSHGIRDFQIEKTSVLR